MENGVRDLRLQRAWSQEHLAECADVSVRTIQRIERGERAGLETLKSVAAALEVNVTELQTGSGQINPDSQERADMSQTVAIEDHDEDPAFTQAKKEVRAIKGFYRHISSYLSVMILLLFINLMTSPGYLWVIWPAFGWGIGLLMHGMSMFKSQRLFGSDWEQKQIEKRMAKKQKTSD